MNLFQQIYIFYLSNVKVLKIKCCKFITQYIMQLFGIYTCSQQYFNLNDDVLEIYTIYLPLLHLSQTIIKISKKKPKNRENILKEKQKIDFVILNFSFSLYLLFQLNQDSFFYNNKSNTTDNSMQMNNIFDQDFQESQFLNQSELETYQKMLSLSTGSYCDYLKPEQAGLITFQSEQEDNAKTNDFQLASSSLKRPIPLFLGQLDKKISSIDQKIFGECQKALEQQINVIFSQTLPLNFNETMDNLLKRQQIKIEKESKINHTKFLLRLFFRNYDDQIDKISEQQRQKLGLITRRIKKIKYKSKKLNLKLMKELFGDENSGKNAQIKVLSRKILHKIIRCNLKENILQNNHLQQKKSSMILTKIAGLKCCSSKLIKGAKGQTSLL